MKNPFSRFFRARDKPRDAVSAATTFSFGSSNAGKSVTARSAIQVSVVYACVRVIAETIASLPFGVYEETDAGSVKAVEHPLYRILHDEPNPEMTSLEVSFCLTCSTSFEAGLTRSNCFIVRKGGEFHESERSF